MKPFHPTNHGISSSDVSCEESVEEVEKKVLLGSWRFVKTQAAPPGTQVCWPARTRLFRTLECLWGWTSGRGWPPHSTLLARTGLRRRTTEARPTPFRGLWRWSSRPGRLAPSWTSSTDSSRAAPSSAAAWAGHGFEWRLGGPARRSLCAVLRANSRSQESRRLSSQGLWFLLPARKRIAIKWKGNYRKYRLTLQPLSRGQSNKFLQFYAKSQLFPRLIFPKINLSPSK